MVSLVFAVTALVASPITATPPEFIYSKDVANRHETFKSGCESWSWVGTDSYGISGPPSVSVIECPEGAAHEVEGVAEEGDFQVWLADGMMTVNGRTLQELGESFWVAGGAFAKLKIRGSAYVVGASFKLGHRSKGNVFTSSWQGPQIRTYELADAKAGQPGVNTTFLGQDAHISNGTSPSMDFIFGSTTTVDPASVVVLNCADGSSPDDNFVWSHFHPMGAVYLPFSGTICFASDKVRCAGPGVPRWTSPNLQYFEYFQKINATNAMADRVRDLAEVSEDVCEHPIVFAVTNFDVAYGAGVPNFDDWPVNAHGQTSAAGFGPWGVFQKMTVQHTRFVIAQVSVDDAGEEAVV